MSSHREAPEISKDPSADNTDVYAFVSPDRPGYVTLIANWNPFELPYGGPNFSEFADDVMYEIKISNAGDAQADITFQFNFNTTIRSDSTFLYNTGPIASPDDPNWNRPQTYSVTRIDRQAANQQPKSTVLATGLYCPPVNVGVHSTPDYPSIANQAIHKIGSGVTVFAGQRADGFHVDLGSAFDLGDLRPFQAAYAVPPLLPNMPGVNGLKDLNVHSIAIQLPIASVTRDGRRPSRVASASSVIGVWATASRARARVLGDGTGKYQSYGVYKQVSRLGNPLVNELLNPMARKDEWNASEPADDSDYVRFVRQPELANLIANVLYPTAFPNLAAYKKPRADLEAILLTGIPSGVIPGFQNYTGPTQADMLRLNLAIRPTAQGSENPIGLVAGDAAGFPNGRRPIDDVTAIELKAVAGATIPLVDPSYTPDAAAGALNDGSTVGASNDNAPYGQPYLNKFPYLSHPNSGFTSMPGTPGGDLNSDGNT